MSADKYKDATREQLLAVVAAADDLWRREAAGDMEDGVYAHCMVTVSLALAQCPGTSAHAFCKSTEGQELFQGLEDDSVREEHKQRSGGFVMGVGVPSEEKLPPIKASPWFTSAEAEQVIKADIPDRFPIPPTKVERLGHPVCETCGAPAKFAVQAMTFSIVGARLKYLCTKCNLEERERMADTMEPVSSPLYRKLSAQLEADPDLALLVGESIREIMHTRQIPRVTTAIVDDDLCPKCGGESFVLRDDASGEWLECKQCKYEWQSLI